MIKHPEPLDMNFRAWNTLTLVALLSCKIGIAPPTPSSVPFLKRCFPFTILSGERRGPTNLESELLLLGSKISPPFQKTESGLRVDPLLRAKIQALREDLLELSKQESYYKREVCLTSNHCHGACIYLRRLLKERLGLEATQVTFEPGRNDEGGFEHSFIILKNFFGPDSPLIIDPTIKQFMPKSRRETVHDIFVGSPEEYLSFLTDTKTARGGEAPEDTFRLFLRATETDRFK